MSQPQSPTITQPSTKTKQIATKKVKSKNKIYMYYEIKDDKISRKLKKCPRCGSFMANHKGERPRWTCGSCSYTEYNSQL